MQLRWTLLLVLVVAAGCGERGGREPAATPSPEVRKTAEKTFTGKNEGSLRVNILPAAPTARDTLQAVVQGGDGKLDFYWEIDGEALEVTGDRLAGGTAAKGEEVKVLVKSGPLVASAATTIRNSPPRITSVPFTDPFIHAGVDIEVMPQAEDPDDDPVRFTYRWFINDEELLFADGPVLGGDNFRRGDRILVEIVPFDDEEHGSPFAAEELVIPNAPPVFTTEPPFTFLANGYFYQAGAEDPDDDPLTYFLKSGPEGMSIDSESGLIFWPAKEVVAGEHLVRIEVHDTEGSFAHQEFTLNVNIQ